VDSDHPAPWYDGWETGNGPFAGVRPPREVTDYHTLTYEVTGRIARITFDRPERGNAITADTPVELAHAVERADLDPRVHVMVVSGRARASAAGTTSTSTPSAVAPTTTSRVSAPAPSSTRPCRRPTTTRPAPGTRWSTTR